MKRLIRLSFFVAMIMAVSVFGLTTWTPAAAAKTIEVGYTAPFTGAAGEYGTNGWRGVQLALEDVNEKGIMIGGEKYKIEIIRYDSVCTPVEAVANTRKLIMEDKVAAILGDHCSSCCMAMGPLCDQFQVPAITIECAADGVTKPGHEYYFRIRSPMGLIAPLASPKVIDIFQPKTMGSLLINDDYGHSFTDSFTDELTKQGVKMVTKETFERGTTDFMGVLTKIKKADPDILFYIGSCAEGSMILKQAKELDLDMPFIGDEALGEMELVSLAGPKLTQGVYAVSLWQAVPPEFEKRVKDRFDAPMHYAITFGYDAFMVVARAIESAQSVDPVKIKDAMKKTDFVGLEGRIKFEDFKGYKNQGSAAPYIMMFDKGQRSVVQ